MTPISLSAIVILATFSGHIVQGQFTNAVSCYYCTAESFIPGNPSSNTVYTTGFDNGCGYPFNSTGNGVIQVSCIGTCVTQVTYDGNGKNSIIRMCSLVQPVTGCYNSTLDSPRTATCTSTCTSNLCNGGTVPYVLAGVSSVLPQFNSIASLLLLALVANVSKILQ